MVAALIVAVGYVLTILLMSHVWHFIIVSIVIGAGIGIGYGAMPALIMGAVDVSETASANSVNTLMRSIGTSVASAVAGVILAHMTMSFGPVALPTQNAFRVVLAIGAAAAVIAFAVAIFLPRRAAAKRDAPVEPVVAQELAVATTHHDAPVRTLQGRVVGADGPGVVTVTAHAADGPSSARPARVPMAATASPTCPPSR